MKCESCGTSVTSEEIIMQNIETIIDVGEPQPHSRLNHESLYTRGHKRSKLNAAIEVENMKMQLQEMETTTVNPKYRSKKIFQKVFFIRG